MVLIGSRTSFVGRGKELTEVADLIPEVPLVTLVGAAGAGKTRMAIQLANVLGDEFPDGVVHVDLTTVTPFELDQEVFAARLGHRTFESTIDALAGTTTLIVLDNCEHVLDKVVGPVESLIGNCRDIRVLATSRAPLELVDEHVFPIRPLPLDDAIELLRERGRAAGAELPTGVDIDLHLTDVATRVDCLPLALELAAIRLRSLDPDQVVESLDTGLDLLRRGGGRRTTSDRRHDSLVNAIDWSYRLLDDADATSFCRLAVLAPGFRLERAHAVVDAPDLVDSAELLDRLVAQSLVSTVTEDGRIRYRLLQTVRQYALDQLTSSGELASTRERFVQSVRTVSDSLVARAIERWDDTVVADARDVAPDLIAALRICLEHDETGDRACSMMLPGWGLVHETYAGELARLGAAILERWPPDTPGWGDVAAITATASVRLSHFDHALEQAARAIDVGGLLAVPVGRRAKAMVLQHRGVFADALDEVRGAITDAASLGLPPFTAELRIFEASLLAQLGDVGGAAEAAERARIANADSAPVQAWSRVLEAFITVDENPRRARELAESVAVDGGGIERPGQPATSTAMIARHLALIALWNDDPVGAAKWLDVALRASRTVGERPQAWSSLRCIGLTAARRGDTEGDEEMSTVGRRLVVTCTESNDTPSAGALERRLAERLGLGDIDLAPLAVEGTPYDIGAALLDEILGGTAPATERTRQRTETTDDGRDDAEEVDGRIDFSGDVCDVVWHGQQVRLNSSKGLADLAILIRRQGVEVPAAELMGSYVEQSGVDHSIDNEAKRSLEQRLLELQTDIAEADANNDLARTEALQSEFDQIVDHLTSSLGLGGRQRTTGGSAEKARSAVTWRIRSAIRKIDATLPALGRHLRASVRTGTFCVYDPETTTTWTIRTT